MQKSDRAVKWVTRGGTASFDSEIPVSAGDRDSVTTAAVRAALEAGDREEAERIVAQAQQTPPHDAPGKTLQSSPTPPDPETDRLPPESATVAQAEAHGGAPAVAPARPTAQAESPQAESASPRPEISDGLRDEILRGDAEFFHIFLYDSCDQDGDVVKVLLNGQPFAYVPITHAGATLSVPVSGATPTAIAIEGVYDGGGGITVACRTSQGDGFIRVMAPGEVRYLGIAGR